MMDHKQTEYVAPEGYRYEWRIAADWRMGGSGRGCRMLRCPNQAVAALCRKRKGTKLAPNLPSFQWWTYCADHLYGRKIEDGAVKERILVKNDEVEATAMTTAALSEAGKNG